MFSNRWFSRKGSNNRYYNNLDKYHKENVRRLLDPGQTERVPGGREAKDFVTRCVMRGVPPEVLAMKNIMKVRAVRSVGYGSPQLRDMATKELVGMIPLMDEVSRNHALRMRASALPGIGQAGVDAVFPKIENAGVPNAHAALAVLENNALRNLDGQALVEPQQNHSTHFDVHFQDAQNHLKEPNASPAGTTSPPEPGRAASHTAPESHLQAIQPANRKLNKNKSNSSNWASRQTSCSKMSRKLSKPNRKTRATVSNPTRN